MCNQKTVRTMSDMPSYLFSPSRNKFELLCDSWYDKYNKQRFSLIIFNRLFKFMPQENDPINDRLDAIMKSISLLSEKVSSLDQKIGEAGWTDKSWLDAAERPDKIERMDETLDKEKEKTLASFDSPFCDEPEKETPAVAEQKITDEEVYAAMQDTADTYVENEPEPLGQEGDSFEAEIGLRWLGKIGILALVLGVAFFLKYAFENDWIGEAGRVAIGIMSSVVLIFLGDSLRTKFNEYAATLTGGGIAVLYLSIYSSFAYYELVGQTSAFAAMAIVTALGAFLAVHYDQINLVLLSIVGGFLTPILLSSVTNNEVALFGYITILNLGILGISHYRNWRKVNLLGFVSTLLLFFIWGTRHYDASQFFVTETFLTLWFVIYAVATISHVVINKKEAEESDLLLTVFNALVYFGITYNLMSGAYGDYLGFFAVSMAAIYFILAYLCHQINPKDSQLILFLPAISIFFLTIAAPIQFDGAWVTIAWAVEAIALVGIGFYLRTQLLRYFAWMLLAIVVGRLFYQSDYGVVAAADFTPLLNIRFVTFVICVFACGVIYDLYTKYEDAAADGERSAKPVALFLLSFLLLWNLSTEVSLYYDYQVEARTVKVSESVCTWEKDARGKVTKLCKQDPVELGRVSTSNDELINKTQERKSATLTVLWALYAIILLAFGIGSKNRLLRQMGIGLLIIAIMKFFLSDLWSLGGIYRIVSSIALGVILLSASFAYNKYKEKIKEIL